MGKPDALYLLIKSLSTREKTLVRQSDKGNSGYMVLFDLIARQKGYDERKLKKKLQSQDVSFNISYAKNYLCKHILKCLRDNSDHPGQQMTAMVLEIQILMDRKVSSLVDKLLPKAKAKALSEERFQEFLELSSIEIQRILNSGTKVQANITSIHGINQARAETRKQLVNLGEFQDLYYAYQPVSKRKRNARNKIDLEMVNQFRAHHLLIDPDSAQSARAKMIRYKCLTHILAFSGELQASLDLRKESIAFFESHGFLIEDYPSEYLNDLVALGALQLQFKDFEACLGSLENIRTFQNNCSLHGSEFFDKYFRLLLAHAIESGSFASLNERLPEIHLGLKTYRDSLPWTSLSMMFFFLARISFEQADYPEARRLLKEILQHNNQGIREDISSLARILNIFTYLESGELEMTEAQSRATRKYLRRREQLHLFEKRVLRFLEHHSFQPNNREELKALEKLKLDLEEIFTDRFEASILAYFDILAWLEDKIKALR